ncbi:DUF3604 domain-containing protein [uncultured Ruegeria sp.]|uniref:DUF3604 domain-containing protein n=1 Tax=uncultured Ruegeria sp. TaxID=259304 RepID=UPI00261DAD13|nr:DUF3604 domain-containing protein [uncultured Ruegeria sp.]
MYLKALTISAMAVCSAAIAQDAPPWNPGDREYSPYPQQDFPNQVLFGDTHLHTSYSPDAGMIGNNLGPAEAFKFAKGEEVVSSMGVPVRLVRPLDWLVISDHAEGLGVAPMLKRDDPAVLDTEFGRTLHGYVQDGSAEAAGEAWNLWAGSRFEGKNPYSNNPEFSRGPWEETIDAADAANEPGLFSAIIGFEWSSTPNGNNMHRVVVYRDGKDVANSRVPLSSDSGVNPEALWDWMEALEVETGGRVLAIPHNGNLSNGLMFDDTRYDSDEPIDKAYAERRARWEPLYEVTQMKGDGEAHPMLSPDDPFADFETWDTANFGADAKTPEMLPNEYVRPALRRGLAYEAQLGANPFKFGMIGSTDSHTSLPTTREDNFFGKVAQLEPTADPVRFEETIAGRLGAPENAIKAWQTSASGLAAVWARENTREAIFDAMQRKEVYATSGTRIRVRVFAGYDFEESDLPRSDFAVHGYANGVPMGGDLGKSESRAPRFLVRALRDPDGANLDRVQIIKGWLNADGTTSEKVYDVSCGGREVIEGICDDLVGNTVNAREATYTNDIGQAILGGYWEDPDFDPEQSAFYYVRVLEIPTPRWTTYDRKFFGVELPEGAPESIQDRAYTSPIWYTP